jgi:hypothetical protein
MHGSKVLRVNVVEETAGYRDAVAEILRVIQNDHHVTLLEIADATDISLGTVSNAANKKADLNPIYLKRLGYFYGPHTLDPYAKLMGGRLVPLDVEGDEDVLPIITMASHRIALARSPQSPAGVVETLREQLDYLADLRRVQREIGALICRIEKRKEAA